MKAELYTWSTCPFCVRAKGLLEKHDVSYVEHVMDGKNAELAEVKRRYGHSTVPIVLLDGEFVGGVEEPGAVGRPGGPQRAK